MSIASYHTREGASGEKRDEKNYQVTRRRPLRHRLEQHLSPFLKLEPQFKEHTVPDCQGRLAGRVVELERGKKFILDASLSKQKEDRA